jgi:hypothetical protein
MSESSSAAAVHSPGGHDQHDDQRLTYRYATAADLVRFYGEKRPETMRAVVVLRGDEPMVVIGLANRRDAAVLFSDYKPEAYEFRHSMTVLRAIKLTMKMVMKSKRPVYSVRQEGTDLLDRLGFIHVAEDVYRWPS